MACPTCGSEKRAELGSEMNIHVPGRQGIDKAGAWVFAKLEVCMGCGLTLFTIPETELRQLEKGIAV